MHLLAWKALYNWHSHLNLLSKVLMDLLQMYQVPTWPASLACVKTCRDGSMYDLTFCLCDHSYLVHLLLAITIPMPCLNAFWHGILTSVYIFKNVSYTSWYIVSASTTVKTKISDAMYAHIFHMISSALCVYVEKKQQKKPKNKTKPYRLS